jgi:hypothetical protein
MLDDQHSLKLIQTHCGDIRQRIQACRSRQIAEQLKGRLCGELQGDCPSEMVVTLLSKHVDQIIDQTFDENGKNRYLEEK